MADVQKLTPMEIDGLYDTDAYALTLTNQTTDAKAQDMYFEVPAGRRGIQRILVFLQEAGNLANLTITFKAGDLWCASAKKVTLTKNTTQMVMLETARHIKKPTSSITQEHITFTISAPAANKDLATDNVFSAGVVFLY